MPYWQIFKALVFFIFAASPTFAQSSSSPAQIPPGDESQVDVLWNIVPEKVEKDIFGKKINEKYYAVEIVISNNSGHDVRIKNMSFALPGDKASNLSPINMEIVANDIHDGFRLRNLYRPTFQGSLFVPDNTQVRTMAFFPRNLIKVKTDDPQKIMAALGQLILNADQFSCARSITIPR
jgi:hypothetical protein